MVLTWKHYTGSKTWKWQHSKCVFQQTFWLARTAQEGKLNSIKTYSADPVNLTTSKMTACPTESANPSEQSSKQATGQGE